MTAKATNKDASTLEWLRVLVPIGKETPIEVLRSNNSQTLCNPQCSPIHTKEYHLLKDYDQKNSDEILVEELAGIKWKTVLFLRDMGVTHLPANTSNNQALKLKRSNDCKNGRVSIH